MMKFGMIDWDKYDELLIKYLPNMSAAEWCRLYAPSINTKTVSRRAKKLQISIGKSKVSAEARLKIANANRGKKFKRINWGHYDRLLIEHLPHMAITEWCMTYGTDISPKTVQHRAKKLGIIHGKYVPSHEHKLNIINSNSITTPEEIDTVKKLRDMHSISQIASILKCSKRRIISICRKYQIKLTKIGIERARKQSGNGGLGRTPWNKGKKLSAEHLEKMAIGRQKMSGRLSNIQLTFYRILDELEISYKPESDDSCRFGPWTFDCRITHGIHDLLVEVQGTYIHSLPKNVAKDRAKATYMERYFPHIPIKYVWEHEFGAANRIKFQVMKWLGLTEESQIDFNFNDVVIKQITSNEAGEFLSAFHYLDKLAGRYCFGAILNDELIAASVWSAPTRSETAVRLNTTISKCLELRRFVIHDRYHKHNFASWLLSKYEKILPKNLDVLVSFCDPAVGHNGTIYKAANWKYDGDTESSYFYVDNDGYVMLKKTLYNQAHKSHMSESEFARIFNYVKVPSPPKLRYIKVL